MLKSALLFFVLIFPSVVFARLGESENELIVRFGKPVSKVKETTSAQGKFPEIGMILTFRQGDWSIQCSLTDGRCSKISYSKSGDWSNDQILTVLNSNSQGARWSEISNDAIKNLQRTWKRADGGIATWQLASGMTLTNPAYDRAKSRAEAKAKGDAAKIPKI